MKNIEEGLRRRIGSDHLLGCYTIKENGKAYFTDIRGGEGDLVKNPFTPDYDLEVEYNGPILEVGVFYSFLWHLQEDNSIVIVGQPSKVENKKFLAGLFDARLRLSGSNLELFNNFQKTIFNEVTGAQHTYIYELLQNANDYPHNKEHVSVKFILTDHYLFFMHSGACFNLRNVVGISSINQGEKKKNTGTIGYKGIGFKTVFVNNEYVFLKSGDWSLRFDRKYSERQFYGDCPWALMPIPTDVSELEEEARGVISKEAMRVQFALRHKFDARKNIEQLDKVFCDNQILLFIPNVYKVEVVIDGEIRHLVEKDASKWVVSDYKYDVPADLKKWVEDNINSGDKIPEKFKDIDKVRISFAVGREGKKLLPVENARVYNYLPTELRLGFNFLFNADFVPNGSRSGLHDVNWNDRIMEQCGSLFADWWVSFLENEGEYELNSVFSILPEFNTRDKYAILFLKGFSKRILEIPCIPTLRDGVYHLVKLEDALYDKIGFIACDKPILSDEELYEFSDTTGSLPHPEVRCNEKLKTLLSHFNCSIPFGDIDLAQLCYEDDFKNWLSTEDHDYKFIGFLLESGYIMNYWDYKIFLTEDGRIERANSIYYDIDKYIDDIRFLSSDLPRLDVSLRDKLAANYNTWASNTSRFKAFNDYVFTRNIFQNFSKYEELLQIKENSVHFIHFLSLLSMADSIPANYPFFDEEGQMIIGNNGLFQKNDIGEEFRSHNWIKNEWIKFLHNDYFERDVENVKLYLEAKCKIKELTIGDCFKSFIANDLLVPEIAALLYENKSNIDFYRYLSNIQDHVTNFTPLMRSKFVVLTTDGRNEFRTAVTATIFKQDEEWNAMTQESWMPNGCCLAISNDYFKDIESQEAEQLQSFLSSKQIIQKFSVAGLYQSLRTRLKDVFSKITCKEISKDFLNFLFLNRNQIFKGGNIDSQFKGIPVQCKDANELCTIESLNKRLYLSNPDALNLYNQHWFSKEHLYLCDDYYLDLFDGSERCDFFIQIGLKKFDKIHYLRAHLLNHLERIEANLSIRDNNIAFHRYIADVHASLSEKDLEGVKEMPIYISSPDDNNGIMVDASNNHYMPSELLSEIISKDLVPLSIMDSIHPDYIQNDSDIKYFTDKLSNVEIDEEGFFAYIVKEQTSEKIIPYLKNRDRNIRFWRWVCDSKANRDQKAQLAIFPMLARGVDAADDDQYEIPANLYISGLYTSTEGIEEFINEHIVNPSFVSPAYLEEGTIRDWCNLFKILKVTVDYKEIVLKNVLPNLSRYKTTSIIGILSDQVDAIISKLNSGDEGIRKNLNNLQLLCNDGLYRTPKEVIVSGKYYDILLNPFPDIIINNLVSEEYITQYEDDSTKRRAVVKLLTAIADKYEVKCETATQLRNAKLNNYIKHQNFYMSSDAHYRIIAELAKEFDKDNVGIRELIHELGNFDLFTTSGEVAKSYSLYLSTAYIPDCQYMANGITELSFVSERYDEYYPNGMKNLFNALGVKNGFGELNLKLLKNEQFAIYFWGKYAPAHEGNLKSILNEDNLRSLCCIPTTEGMKKPMELYNYRNPQLQKIVLKLANGQSKIPAIELPDWLNYVGFRNRLYLLDCLEYLKLNDINFRRDVIGWILNAPEETLSKHKRDIELYCEEAQWYNGAKAWVPLKTLVALEWGNTTLKDNFGGNVCVCNPSYMPEYQTDYNKLCKILNIKTLTNNDFTKSKAGKFKTDDAAIHEITMRLMYLAYKTGKEDWRELYEEYKNKIDKADICTCEKIVYSYNESISTDLEIYAEDATALWYVDSWKGPMFLEVLEWIVKKLEVKGSFDQNFLRKLFLRPFKSFVKQEEGGSLPQEFLDCMDESDREGINTDQNANAEAFDEDNDDTNELSESHKQEAAQAREQRKDTWSSDNKEEPAYSSSSNDSSTSSHYATPEDHEQDTSQVDSDTDDSSQQRKRRSDFGGTHNKRNDPTKENSTSSNKNESENNTSNSQSTQEEPKRPIEDRLKEKWEKKAQSSIKRPMSSSGSQSEYKEMSGGSKPDNAPSKDPFFDNDKADSSYSEPSARSSMSKTSQNIKRKNTEARNSAQNAEDQETLFNLWCRTPMYSFLWFKYLMELQYADRGKISRRTAQIDFNSYEILSGEEVVRLSNPSTNIPTWIEHADIMEVTLMGKTAKKIEASIVKVDEFGVCILVDTKDSENFKNIRKIRIVAESTSNIIDSLTTRFLQLDYDDEYNLEKNLPENIKFIYGPPGTGKTTRLVEILHDIVSSSDERLNILVLTPTNKAADVIATKLVDDDDCYQYLTRFGSTESQYLIEDAAILQTRDTTDMDYFEKNIVVTTAARYSYDCVQPDDTPICDYDWDYIIIDEASMIDLVTITYILHKGMGAEFIIAGDPKQIQPVNQGDIETQNIYQMIGLDSFRDAIENYKRYPVEALTVQHRSVPSIGNLVSKFSYNGMLTNDNQRAPQKPLKLDGIKTSDINFVGFKIEEFDRLYGLTAIKDSAFHLYSAIFTYNMVDYVVKQLSNNNPNCNYSIGIVCPYKAEADAIKQMLDHRSLDSDTCTVTSGTVHKFQGDECDIMFIVLNPPANVTSGSHVNKDNIINVAMSRARDYIFFIVPDGQIDGFKVKNRLGKIVQTEERTITHCSKIEEVMFGNNNFIYENTNVSCHLPVNVFYDTYSRYEVRIDDTTLDIQINDIE